MIGYCIFLQQNKYYFTEASRNFTLGISKNKAAKYLKTNKEHAGSKNFKGVQKIFILRYSPLKT
jgi:hypothetical protein